jgi:hypothetical protein
MLNFLVFGMFCIRMANTFNIDSPFCYLCPFISLLISYSLVWLPSFSLRRVILISCYCLLLVRTVIACEPTGTELRPSILPHFPVWSWIPASWLLCLPLSRWFLPWLILRSWSYRPHVSTKHRLNLRNYEQFCIPEDSTLHNHWYENLTSFVLILPCSLWKINNCSSPLFVMSCRIYTQTTKKHNGRPPSRMHLMQQTNTCNTATHRNKNEIRPTKSWDRTCAWLKSSSKLKKNTRQ